MQWDEAHRIQLPIARLSDLLGVDEDMLRTLATAHDAPLGPRARTTSTSKEALFTLDGATQVRVTPDDDRCVAALITARGDAPPARLAVDVYSGARL